MCNLPRCINDSLNNYRAISSFVPRWLGSFENSKGFRREICIRKLMGTRNRLSLASQIKRCSVLTRNRDDNLHTCRKKRTVIFRFHGKGVAAATLRADIFNGHAESRTLAFSFLSFPPSSPPFSSFFLLFIADTITFVATVLNERSLRCLLFDRSKFERSKKCV